jgi:Tol biopolymer transport system component
MAPSVREAMIPERSFRDCRGRPIVCPGERIGDRVRTGWRQQSQRHARLALLAAGVVAVLAGASFRGAAPAHRYLVTAGSVRSGLSVEILDQTGRVERVVVRGQAWAKWSPDGSLLAWTDHSGLSVERTDGTGERLLVSAAAACTAGCTASSFAWSQDGHSLAFGGGGTGMNRLVVISVESGRQLFLAPVRHDMHYDVLGWMPDGHAIVYQRFQGSAGFDCCRRDLRIVASDGSGTRVVHTYPYKQGSSPSLSPDGRMVAALYWKGLGFIVRVLDLRTDRERAIARVYSSFWRPVWSPDSRRLVVVSTKGQVVTMAASGGDIRLLGAAGLVASTRAGDLLIARGRTREGLAQIWKSSDGKPAHFLFRLLRGTGLVTIEER